MRANTEEGIGVHAAIECAGVGAALNACVDAVRRQGTVVQVGPADQPGRGQSADLGVQGHHRAGKHLLPGDSWPRVMAMIASGAFPVEKIVTSIVSLDDALTLGFERLLDPSGEELKVLLRVAGR